MEIVNTLKVQMYNLRKGWTVKMNDIWYSNTPDGELTIAHGSVVSADAILSGYVSPALVDFSTGRIEEYNIINAATGLVVLDYELPPTKLKGMSTIEALHYMLDRKHDWIERNNIPDEEVEMIHKLEYIGPLNPNGTFVDLQSDKYWIWVAYKDINDPTISTHQSVFDKHSHSIPSKFAELLDPSTLYPS